MADRLVVLLPGITAVMYAVTACAFCAKKQPSWAVVYFSYAAANVGLIWASLLTKGS